MKVWIGGQLRPAELTTEHAASSYGRPVLVIDGEAFSPFDVAANAMYLAVASKGERKALADAGYRFPPEPWGLRLRRARISARMTQAELAAKCGLTQSEIARLESRVHPPSAKLIDRVGKVLKF